MGQKQAISTVFYFEFKHKIYFTFNYVHVSKMLALSRGIRSPLSRRYKLLGVACRECWEQNPDPLEEKHTLLATEPLLQPPNMNSWCLTNGSYFMMLNLGFLIQNDG